MYIPVMLIFGRRAKELEARIAALEAAVKPAELEALASAIQQRIPEIVDEATGKINHEARISEAFRLARHWLAERGK